MVSQYELGPSRVIISIDRGNTGHWEKMEKGCESRMTK